MAKNMPFTVSKIAFHIFKWMHTNYDKENNTITYVP